MVLTRTFKNKVRDLIYDELLEGVLGTDDTTPTESDTSLGAEESATTETLTKEKFDKGYSVSYVLPSGDGNGVTYKEFGIKLTDGTLHSRNVFSDFEKTSSDELTIASVVIIE